MNDFKKTVGALKKFYAIGRRGTLPWRRTRNPYRVLVSEIMLQQTQVDRVIPYYRAFLKMFPTLSALAQATLRDVLEVWQGLGYNRRARYLHQTAQAIVLRHRGRVPRAVSDLEALPGIGSYTARAVAAFAYNAPEVFIETNIRTVLFHHQPHHHPIKKISDAQLLPLVEQMLQGSKMEPREFYAAMMDYGAYLKKSGIKLNHHSAHHTKQTAFTGSARQLRGALVRELLQKPANVSQLVAKTKRPPEEVTIQLQRLITEGLVMKRGAQYRVA